MWQYLDFGAPGLGAQELGRQLKCTGLARNESGKIIE